MENGGDGWKRQEGRHSLLTGDHDDDKHYESQNHNQDNKLNNWDR